jgi:hypothetical protein
MQAVVFSPETDDRVRGIIYRAPGVKDQPFCMGNLNRQHYGQGRQTYRYPAAPNNRHLVRVDQQFIWWIDYRFARRMFR